MRYYLIILVGLWFGGCSVTKPPLTEYSIDINLPIIESTSKECSLKSIKVAQSFSSNKLKTLNMNYAQDNTKIYTYSLSVWAESPNDAITSQVVKILREKKIFNNVQISRSRAKSDFILEVNIEKFIQSFNKDLTNSYADVFITFSLIDAKTNKVIASQNFKAKEGALGDANGGVKALTNALSTVLVKSTDWLEEVCR